MERGTRQSEATWRWALALWALLAGIYLLTTGGHTYASDEEAMFAMAENLWLHGNFAVEQGPPLRFSQYNPGQPFAALPLYALGRLLVPFFPPEAENWLLRALLSWFNPVVTAGSAVALLYATLRLGYSRRVALGTGLLYGLGTLAWPHSKTFFAEPLTALLLIAGFACMLGADDGRWNDLVRRPSSVVRFLCPFFLGGLLCGAALLVKIHAVLMLPALGLYALLVGFTTKTRSTQTQQRFRALGAFVVKAFSPALAWGGGLALVGGVLMLVQWWNFGDPLRTGYGSGTGEFLGNSLSPGLYGLTFSPGKGIVWYAPPLLLLPVACWHFWRTHWRAAFTCGLVVAVNILFYAQIFVWHGDGAWGPRYLNMMLPFAALPLAAYLADLRGRATPVRLAGLALAIALALPVQLGALAIHFNTYIGLQRDADKRYFAPAHSPILHHLLLAGAQMRDGYDRWIAPNRLILADGWSYSEGDRAQGEQLPRWTGPEATLTARSWGSPIVVALTLDGCRPPPVPPARVVVRAGAVALLETSPCPAQTVRLVLPSPERELTISAEGWDPQTVGIDREGPLGVRVTRITAQAGGNEVALAGRLVPVRPMPSGFVSLRNWFGDPRYGHWDLWWWYMVQSGLPARPLLLLATLWATLGLGLACWGGMTLTMLWGRSTRVSPQSTQRTQRQKTTSLRPPRTLR